MRSILKARSFTASVVDIRAKPRCTIKGYAEPTSSDRGSLTMADLPKPTEERILVCVSPSPSSAQVIGAASKMATSLHAKWSAVYVEQPKMAVLPEAERSRAADSYPFPRSPDRLATSIFNSCPRPASFAASCPIADQ